jgi:predicted transcriptional regulator of viral defense system
MIEEKSRVFFLTENNLREVIKDIFDEAFQKLEIKLNKKSKILTREDAAKLIGVCPNTISEYIKSGRLTNRGIGRKLLILESDLEGIKPGRYTHYSKNN